MQVKTAKNQLQSYHEEWNQRSLDGLPGLMSAHPHDNGRSKLIRVGRWIGDVLRQHRGIIDTIILALAVLVGVLLRVGLLSVELRVAYPSSPK